MLAMIIFFLSSMYLTNLFASKIVKAREDENFGDGDYKKLFEFRPVNKHDDEDSSDDPNDNDDRIDKSGM
jgi:hypothetical protein